MSVVVVTGGTRGIGRGLVTQFLARGCQVAFCGQSTGSVEKALAELSAGDRVIGVVADVSKESDLQQLWDKAVSAFGRVDVWVNNAGISASRKPLAEIDPAEAARVIEVNLGGVIAGSRVAIRGFLAQGDGALWNMEGFGSNGQTAPGMIAYGASKRAVTYLTKALVKETKGTPVRVSLLSPGIVLTDLLERDYDGDPEAWEKAKKIFRILGDRVETVTPYLASGVLASRKTGDSVTWLTKRKAFARFATAALTKRDPFTV